MRSRSRAGSQELTDTTNRPRRSLVKGSGTSGGRGNQGRITVRFRGGGHKRRYRVIDFRRDKDGVPATVVRIEYDPNRSARIALLKYADGEYRYIIAPVGLGLGQTVYSSADADVQPGNCLPLSKMPLGTQVHAIELKPGRGAQLVRSAGGSAQVMARESGEVMLRLPSGEVRKVRESCKATVGQVGNTGHENRKLGKAGRSRWLGRRPHNRGVTMNPVDHPHGGGEGRTAGGRHPVTPQGKPTRGAKTRRRGDNPMIVSRRTRKRRK